jgi:hypothetical protein
MIKIRSERGETIKERYQCRLVERSLGFGESCFVFGSWSWLVVRSTSECEGG